MYTLWKRRGSKNGIPRYKCKNCKKAFQTDYVDKGAKLETKSPIIKMSVNGSGIRDIAKILKINKNTIMNVKKMEERLSNVNPKYVNLEKPVTVRIEMDEMWVKVYLKKTPC